MSSHQIQLQRPCEAGQHGIVLIRDGIVLIWRGLRRLGGDLTGPLAVLVRRAKARRELAALDERLCRDIGLSRDEARRQSAKPFWKA